MVHIELFPIGTMPGSAGPEASIVSSENQKIRLLSHRCRRIAFSGNCDDFIDFISKS